MLINYNCSLKLLKLVHFSPACPEFNLYIRKKIILDGNPQQTCYQTELNNNVIRKLMRLVEPLDYCPFLLFHVGTKDIAARSPRSVKRDLRTLGRKLKNSGARIGGVFLSPPSNEERHSMKEVSPGHQHLTSRLMLPPELCFL